MTDLKIGDFVILNYSECPEADNISLVLDIKKENMVTRYISEKMKGWGKLTQERIRGTKIEDFGVSLQTIGDSFDVIQVYKNKDSTAEYEDGRRRHWQGKYSTVLAINKKFSQSIIAQIRLNVLLEMDAHNGTE